MYTNNIFGRFSRFTAVLLRVNTQRPRCAFSYFFFFHFSSRSLRHSVPSFPSRSTIIIIIINWVYYIIIIPTTNAGYNIEIDPFAIIYIYIYV